VDARDKLIAEQGATIERLMAELAAARAEVAATLAPYRGREFCVFHPAFGYFAAAFGLRQTAVQRGGREPSARELAALIDGARADGVRAVFVQPQYAPRSARTVADAIGARLVPLDDLARDYPANLRRMAAALAAAFAAADAAREAR
jgi:zinc transport system substrate-binding protein